VVLVIFFGPFDQISRYLHFSTLTKERLTHEARVYIDRRAGGGQMACLYAVSCEGERARLVLIDDLETWDFASAKNTIWRRALGDSCSGRTTNFALHLIPHEGHEARVESLSRARWSFFNDRFIPIQDRFQSSSFSDETWEHCTAERAVIR